MNPTKTDILILGAGIGGFETYRTLVKLLARHKINKTITLIDQNNYFTFVPMLHEVVSGSIEPDHCTIPLHQIVSSPHKFIRSVVKKIDPATQTVITAEGTISYETCVVALGSGVNYFGVDGAKEHTLNCRTLDGVLNLRHRLIELLEGPKEKLQLVLVGGGYTGVEVAGQVAEFALKFIPRFYPDKKISLYLLESAPSILMGLPPIVQSRVTKRLYRMGVHVLTKQQVKKISATNLAIANFPDLASDLTIWTAGVGNVAPNFLGNGWCQNGRIPVNEFLQHPKSSALYALGDIALFTNPGGERPVPQLGETAHKMGEYVAQNIVDNCTKRAPRPFKFRSLGTLMPVGDWWAAAIIGRFIFFGRLAWWLRRTVYVMFMPGLIYKLKIIIDWTWHIFGVRDIISIERKNK